MTRPSSPPRRRHLALWWPFLPTDRLRRQSPAAAPDDAALACVEAVRGALRLSAVDPVAADRGLAPGMTLADARALLPELVVVDADPFADHGWLEALADACDRYTPMVALDGGDGVTLDITGCAHLWGGEGALVAEVEARFAWAGTLRHALADTPDAAQALARFQHTPAASEAAAIRRLGVAALRLDDEIVVALRRAGLKTIGDLASRPTAPIAARFGEETVAALQRLLGEADQRLRPRRALPALFFERRFAEPIARDADVLAAIGELAGEAEAELVARDRGGRRFAVRLYRADGATRDLAVESGLPLRDPPTILRLMRERIAALADPLDPGFGFDMLRLSVPALEPLVPTQLQLEGGTVSEEAMVALVDRLSTRLGRGRVSRVRPGDSHLPEQGMLTIIAQDAAPAPVAWDVPEAGEPPLRPIHLFDPPQRIEVMAEVPDGPPHRFRWRRAQHDVIRFEGPERIAAQWWRRGQARPRTRDYYRVEDVRGRRYWIFRHGLYERETADPAWYVHGVFA
ncbi:nucleotidyltransferase [Sphingomonas sp. Leaf407]|uniref:Y-family DNA polymerase n=1 Tax=unclassified Sphingomonas TaxID=196159 RepID=UPI0006F6D440|nr:MULTISPECIES: DNA polymerase Y family protein [unclassified Sphingomonas]KQN36471.1 nucleotidyltransferase [Sphingomonas sp. Leaf42]KQT27091.1 nucleotidyltransferase [Sphingomonas sp. Leaf407]